MQALLSIPVPTLPNAFLYEVAFTSILAVVCVLVAAFPILRKRQFAAALLLIGIIEFFVIAKIGYYTIPPSLPIISLITVMSGIIIPLFYVARRLFSRKGIKLLLVISGCIELVFGAIRLLDYHYFWGFLNLYPIAILATIGIYSLSVGTFLLMKNEKASSNK